MHLCVTFSAQSDEVLLGIAPTMAAEFHVVNLQALHPAAHLASPSVALENLPMQFAISLEVKSDPRLLEVGLVHEALPVISEKKTPLLRSGKQTVIAGKRLQQDFRVVAVHRGAS